MNSFAEGKAKIIFNSTRDACPEKPGLFWGCTVARRLRIQFENAIYHVMARGNLRQNIVADDFDREALVARLGGDVVRFRWRLLSFVVMTNHLHLFVQTPEPNLAQGMQSLLSGYANRQMKRRGQPGHLFQGRYRCQLVEDESYFCEISRYLHLNPVRAGLVTHPRDYFWSSYPGYEDPRKQWPFVAENDLLSSWQGRFGGDADSLRRHYVDFVAAGARVEEAGPPALWKAAKQGWIIGSDAFVKRMRDRMRAEASTSARLSPEARTLDRALELNVVLEAVKAHYRVGDEELSRRRRGEETQVRAAAAWFARRYTTASRAILADRLGLSRPESVPKLVDWWSLRRAEPAIHAHEQALLHALFLITKSDP